MWEGVRTVYLKAAFVEICLHGRGETVAATIYCQVRVPDTWRAIIFQCKADMPHGGRAFQPNCFVCDVSAREKFLAIDSVSDTMHQAVLKCA